MKAKRFNLLIVLLAATLALILGIGVGTTNVALANEGKVSGTYGGQNTDNLWYYGTTDLNVSAIRDTIIAWDLPSRMALNTYLKNNPIVIAVADTGCNVSHEIFDGVLLKDQNGEFVRYNSYSKKSGIEDITDASKDYHGTGMMSTMAMMIKDLGLEEYIKLVPIKASYTNTKNKKNPYEAFTLNATREAIRYAAEDIHADILNLSYGILESKVGKDGDWIHDEKLAEIINSACDQLVLVAAAGNDNKNSADDAYYLAANENVIGVMGYNEEKNKYDNSNFGNSYDMYAPATNIYAASSGTDKYKTGTGTSYATTFVSISTALYEIRAKAESFTGDEFPVVNPRKITRVIRQHSPSVITYSYIENAGTQNEKRLTYTQPKLNLYSLLTEDYSDIDTKYDPVNGIGITQDGTQFVDVEDETLGNIKLATVSIHDSGEINLKAYLKPKNDTDPTLDKNITWIITDEDGEKHVIATGSELKYFVTQNDVTKSQEQIPRLKLQAEYGSYVETWYVDFQFDAYNNNSSVQLHIDSKVKDGVVDLKEPITLSISGMEYVNKNVGIIWYVNDEIFATTTTTTVIFTPTEEGTYTFSAQYAQWPKKILNTCTVKAEINVWLIVTTTVAAFLVFGLIVVIVVAICLKHIKKKEKPEKAPKEKSEESVGPKEKYKPSTTVWLIIGLLVSFVILIAFYSVAMVKSDELSIDSNMAILGLVLILVVFVFVGAILFLQILKERKKEKPVDMEEQIDEGEAEPAEETEQVEEESAEVVEEKAEENNEQ